MAATKLKIRLYGDPCLRAPAQKVSEVGPAERMLIQNMVSTMRAAQGVGLAAPQVGISRRIFVADVGEGPMAFINPEILHGTDDEPMDEGCLSIPGVQVEVTRPTDIVVRYTDENNQKQEGRFSGLMARVIQHETDHLNGKLIVDYAGKEDKVDMSNVLKELESLYKEKA